MNGQLFIAPGDITQLAAHAIGYSTATTLAGQGQLYHSFRTQVPGFSEWLAELHARHPGRASIGQTFWMPLATDKRPHGVVLTVAAGGPATVEDKAAIAVRAAVDEAVDQLRKLRGPSERLLVALPAFRIGVAADHDWPLRSARAQVAAALEALARHPGVDVAFIAYTPAIYQIFLEARRHVLGTPKPEAMCDAALEEALAAGECVLFLGAGLSRSAGLPDWEELVAGLARALGISAHHGLDYLDLAQWYREQFDPASLADLLQRTFGDPAATARPTLAHYFLMSLPVRLVLTTNYDDLVERTLRALKRYPKMIDRQEDVVRTGRGDGVHVVKLHGDAASAHRVVLCRDDYDEFFEQRPAMALLLEGLLLNRTFFFAGYGLRDPNFRQIFSRIARMLREARRPAFATWFAPSGESAPYVVRQWAKKQIHLIGIPGADTAEREVHLLRFLDRLAERVALRRPGLLLAPDVEPSAPLARLREILVKEVSAELEAICQGLRGPLKDRWDVHHLAEVLELLTDHGWRPSRGVGWGLSDLWEALAGFAPEDTQRRRLLVSALGSAEAFDDVERILGELAKLEGRGRSVGTPGTVKDGPASA